MTRQTYFAKTDEVANDWYIVDATDIPLGRLASPIAVKLMGKHKPQYTPHIDTGDFIIVTNASNIKLTGNKADQKFEKSYSGHPGGLKLTSYRTLIEQRPERVIELAVRRMLPKTSMGRKMMKKLKIYAGADHPHAAQQPKVLELNITIR